MNSRDATDFVKVGHIVLAGRSEVGNEGYLIADALEIGQSQVNTSSFSHGEEVQDAICAAAKRHEHDQCIFE